MKTFHMEKIVQVKSKGKRQQARIKCIADSGKLLLKTKNFHTWTKI